MPLEAVMVCIDNSDYTRNGDYMPTRFDSQTDAVNLLCGAKTNQNPENSIGLLTTAGDRIEVLITPTSDLGKILAELPKMKIGGNSDLLRAIQTAQLALKHRQNKNQKQRIIAFVGGPVVASDRELEMLGKNLKKNNVSIDIVSFGEVEDNTPKLEKLLTAVNSSETSHLVEVPVGPKLLSDVLLTSVIVNPDGDVAGGGGGGGGDAGFEFGIDPSNDPELALALRISMEEERARQQQSDAGAGGTAPATVPAGEAAAPAATTTPAAAEPAPAAAPLPMASGDAVLEAMGMEDMDEELRQALLLSLQESGPPPTESAPAAESAPTAESAPASEAAPAAEPAPAPAAPAPPAVEKDVTMSDAQPPAAATPAASAPAGAEAAAGVDNQWFQDQSFVQELLGSLPGVDINDPRIQEALKEVSDGTGDASGGGSGSGTGGDSGASGGSSK
mmetsp:Transcript_68351/g.153507  ORF Transcript_68351/g.153507 Transcript_68351/m.153507 type:complete len:446 (-) Transcript_68351:52-1389(-)